MISILKNENIKMFGVNTNDNDITFKLKLSKPLVDFGHYDVFSVLYDFHDSIKSILISDETKDYVFKDTDSNDFMFLQNAYEFDNLINYIYLLNIQKKNSVNYDYSNSVYVNEITDNITIKVDYNKNKIILVIDNNVFSKQMLEE